MDTNKKNNVLKSLATLLLKSEQQIIAANKEDVAVCPKDDISLLDRLRVDENKVQSMIDAVNQTIELNDPEGKVLSSFSHENGMLVENKTVPFGNILIIYESRPDVTIEAAITAFKAGNKILLKGGKEAKKTNLVLVDLWKEALSINGLDKNYVTYLDLNRTETQELIANNNNVDLIIPRGGEGLINFVKQNTNIPIIISGRGNNFLYIDQESDFEMAIKIALNGKSRLSVCNALDKVLINKNTPDLSHKINQLINRFQEINIDVFTDEAVFNINSNTTKITDNAIFEEEFLAPKILLSLTDSDDDAIRSINKYSGGHSATIVTSNDATAKKFQTEVDCAAVYHNASTRFTDGGQFGFGAEIAISTQKLHFRGPIGLNELVTNKWFIYGSGQIR
ncbi:MAG: glutamate-5-semialdehyde dehydrogenase [Vicingus serpentipes]|nr:glutamate-5-semialdehyde dehydrogenase [Vicingus serpentipes]